MTTITKNPVITLPKNTTTIYDVQSLAKSDAVAVVREIVNQDADISDDNARMALSDRAHEAADNCIIYTDDQWGIVASNRFGLQLEVDGDELCEENAPLERRIAMTAYALCDQIYDSAYLTAYEGIKNIFDSLADDDHDSVEARWNKAIEQYEDKIRDEGQI